MPKNPTKAAADATGFARLDNEKFPAFEPGSVWLVGAGPGAPGLMSLMSYHAMQSCDVIVYDALVNPDILDWVRPGATLEFAGKRGGKPSPQQTDITLRLIELANTGKRVLRLKGGDPFVFGRGGEESQNLAKASIPFRIVPGITAGVGGLAYAGIPSTHRDTNHSVTFLTGHDASGTMPSNVNWAAVAKASPVIVMYMAVKNSQQIAQALMDGGRDPKDALTFVSNATLPHQTTLTTTLGDLETFLQTKTPKTPAIVVVGQITHWQEILNWYGTTERENAIG